jgi:hypothetical protein
VSVLLSFPATAQTCDPHDWAGLARLIQFCFSILESFVVWYKPQRLCTQFNILANKTSGRISESYPRHGYRYNRNLLTRLLQLCEILHSIDKGSRPQSGIREDFLGTRPSQLSQFFFLTNLAVLCRIIYIYIYIYIYIWRRRDFLWLSLLPNVAASE